MNLFKLSFLLILMTFLASCGDDDDSNCVQADWVGTYTGTQTCTGEDATAVTVTITASGANDVIIAYDDDAGFGSEFDPLTPSGCDIDKSATEQGLTLEIEASVDGNTFTLKEVFSQGAVSNTCNITATRN